MDEDELRSLMESRNINKRKRTFDEEEEEEDDEEEKINKFYSLIKSIREARNRLINMKSSSSDDHRHGVRNKEKIIKQPTAVWKPSFQLEDFMEEDHQHRHRNPNQLMIKTPLDEFTAVPSSFSSPTLDAPSQHQKKEIITIDHQGLDLTLSL